MMNDVGRLWVGPGILLLTMPVGVAAGTTDKPVTGDRVVREALEEVQTRIMQLRKQAKHTSADAGMDIQKAIGELEKKKDLAEKKLQDIHSATVSSWEQAKIKTAVAMDDLRDSLTRTLPHLPSR